MPHRRRAEGYGELKRGVILHRPGIYSNNGIVGQAPRAYQQRTVPIPLNNIIKSYGCVNIILFLY